MKQKMTFKLFLLSFIFIPSAYAFSQKEIVVVIASYNNKDWYEKNLDSVRTQNYENWHIIYIDDCSTDGTGELVEYYIAKHNIRKRVTLIKNKTRHRALANLYYAIHSCEDTKIMAILDGDDWFAHPHVLSRVNQEYANPDVWLTYGQYKVYPTGQNGFCVQIPDATVNQNAFRKFPDGPSHLRTFYAGLFKQIKKEDLMLDGDFFSITYDLAMMFPMLEMAGHHFRFIPDILVEYNEANPINDHKVSKGLQRKVDLIIRAKNPYTPITTPFKS